MINLISNYLLFIIFHFSKHDAGNIKVEKDFIYSKYYVD